MRLWFCVSQLAFCVSCLTSAEPLAWEARAEAIEIAATLSRGSATRAKKVLEAWKGGKDDPLMTELKYAEDKEKLRLSAESKDLFTLREVLEEWKFPEGGRSRVDQILPTLEQPWRNLGELEKGYAAAIDQAKALYDARDWEGLKEHLLAWP